MTGTAPIGKAIAVIACAVLLLVPTAAVTHGATATTYRTVECGTFVEDTGLPIEGQAVPLTCSVDADDDGLTDPREVVAGLNPTVDNAGRDADSDGFPDIYEVKTGSDPNERTDRPTVDDYDGDGVPDRVEMAAGLSPYADSTTGADADSDGLPDSTERQIETDPNDADTDGDGFTDHAEMTEQEKLPHADPLHKDLYYEVDTMTGQRLDSETKGEAKALFERVAVSNPDGEPGITVHFVSDDTIGHESPIEFSEAKFDLDREHRDYEDRGYHYLVVVDELTLRGDGGYNGAANERLDVAMVESNSSGQTLVHESGHLLGLSNSQYDGIDSEKYTADEYPSVMNYGYVDLSKQDEYPVFSDGSAGPNDHDDVEHIEEDMAGTYAPAVNYNATDE